MPRVTLSTEAYVTATLHAAAYPSCAVNGLLLGTQSGHDTAASSTVVTSAVPLFHSNLGLAPLYDVAFALVEAHAQATGVAVVGYYHANAAASETDLTPVARRVADAVAAAHPGSVVLLVRATLASCKRQCARCL
jgi:Uncharacterised protein family (UPF0172)